MQSHRTIRILRTRSIQRRISPAALIACVALFLSMTGVGAAAVGLRITSIHQITPSVRNALRGKPGPRGLRGPQGSPGAPGHGADVPSVNRVYSYVVRGDVTTVPAGQQVSIRTRCQPGMTAMGGGYDVEPASGSYTGNPGVDVLASQPLMDGPDNVPVAAGWVLTIHNPLTQDLLVTPWVTCFGEQYNTPA